ncbi:MAG: hypothetical protein IPH16_12190 [Haliscomenobacter sp.]|nr:hypothetical protein [Haliscomenobacter sp.]MBK8877802.1 hypothetical protein [Haliscomenobacter sp.]
MKLTILSRILIVLVVAVGAFFLVRQFLPKEANGPSPSAEEATVPEESAEEETAGVAAPKAFDFTPPAPVNGTLKGIVELGASGFNSFIVRVDAQKNWKLEKAEFGASLVYENMATEGDIRAGLKEYIRGMLDFGVSPKDIHFMVSSSAIESPAVPKIRAGLKSLGYVVNVVNAEQEGIYALKASLPKAYEGKAFVVDIGSGNTKVAWLAGSTPKSMETFGAKYFQKGASDEQVYKEVSSVAAQVPAAQRSVCFIIGGAPFDMAKTHRNGKERYTVLKAPGDYDQTAQKAKAGATIYQALKDKTGCDTFVFDWDANFTIGFLLSI